MRRFLLAFVAACQAGEPAVVVPEGDLPIDPRFDGLVQQIERERAELGVTGVAVLVMERGEITFAHGFGEKQPGGAAVDAGTLFRIGSVTKVLTTTALLSQIDDGKLTLDDRVDDLVPAFQLAAPAGADRTITVRHLLTHTSGLADHIGPAVNMADHSDAALASYTAGPYTQAGYQMSPAGRMWNYSNPNFSLAGLIVETLDGSTYREAMQARVFDPLAMDRTVFRGEDALADGNVASGVVDGKTEAPDTYDNPWARPAGFAFSSVYDLAKLAKFLLDGGAALSDAQRLAMQAPQIDMQTLGPISAYGFGLFVDDGVFLDDGYHPTPVINHGGDLNGFSADFYFVPSTDFALIVLANADYSHFYGTHELALRQFANLAPAVTPPELRADASGFPELAGTYQDDFNVGRMIVTANQLDLSISMPDLDAAGVTYSRTLMPLLQDNFLITIDGFEEQITFVRDSQGRPEYLRDRFFVGKRTAASKPVRVDRDTLRARLERTRL